MYNLNNHYDNIYQYLRTIITDPRMIFLHPFGSTQPENIEMLRDDNPKDARRGPLFIFYDQEPLNYVYNEKFFNHIKQTYRPPYVLVNTEHQSAEKHRICDYYNFAHVDYFFHIFAAADWYRGHEYLHGLVAPKDRMLKKTYITFNRLTSNERTYRSLFINELYKQDLLESGYVSFSKNCPDGGDYAENLRISVENQLINSSIAEEAIVNIGTLPELRIDFTEQHIPNQSMLLTPMDKLMESFVFVVTETCYWQSKTHLTEKIFKPIALRMPFLLLGCVNNLAYLRSYGFRTFGDFWDESYDAIQDPILRMQAVTNILKHLSSLTQDEQHDMLVKMEPILEHNYQLFNDPDFVKREWDHLKKSLSDMCQLYKFVPPYTLNLRLGQAIPDVPTVS